MVADDAPAFAAWLLQSEVEHVEPLSVELSTEAICADTVFRVQRQDDQQVILHIEFQGRTSTPPMPWRMLDYMARLAQQYRLPIHSVVLYLGQGAGSQDDGQHQHLDGLGGVALTWSYQVIHLCRMRAEDVLRIVGLTQIQAPHETLPQVVATIRAETEPERQALLFQQLIGLLQDEELIAMTENLFTLSAEDLEELKQFPALWRAHQRYEQAARIEGERKRGRADILEALVVRFDPPASEYLKVEQALAAIDDLEELRDVFRTVLRAADVAEVVAALPAVE